ncbi:Smg-4/UPF3 family-domain-containing protein [Cyathus striatus]|nr:Smg-4/UPF3 family-domain-containing protein [Cyathus striatus]
MSTAATNTKKQSPTRYRKEKENKEKVQRGNERLKVVVRRLPPNLPEEVFWQSVQDWVSEDTVSWKVYYPGKFKTRLNKENIPSRAYIAFKNIEQLARFSREYDGHLFRDKAGNESFAIVEFAPYQKVPSEKKKQDSRNATIEKDEDFISFVESLKAAANAEPVTLESLIAATKPTTPPKTTPLLEALKAEKTAQKDKETILRSHAHYKDVSLLRSKDDSKKKAIAAAAANPKSIAAEGAGKRGKKGGPSAALATTQNQNHKIASGAKAGVPPPPQSSASSGAPPPNTPGRKSKAQKYAQQARVQSTGTSGTSAPVNAQASVTTVTAPKGSADVGPPASQASGAPRRARPVIGLASRQFEAALSGVGVPAGERKGKREKEKEQEGHSAVGVSNANGASTSAGTSE